MTQYTEDWITKRQAELDALREWMFARMTPEERAAHEAQTANLVRALDDLNAEMSKTLTI